jgi:hypothetical protein
VQLKGSEDLKELLSSGGYKLITKRSEGSESKLSFPSVVPVTSDQNSVISGTAETENVPAPSLDVQETAAVGAEPQPEQSRQSEQPERSEASSLLDEYLSLSAEIQEITEIKSAAIGTAIGELLEENADVLGEKGDEFFGLRDTYIASINSIVDEENALSETVEEAGQKITPEQLETTKANHKKLLDLYAELEALKTLVNVYLAEEEHRLEAESLSPIVAPEENAESLPEKANLAESGANKVVHIDDYRKNAQSKPIAAPMDSPFGEVSSKKTGTNEDESKVVVADTEVVLPEKKELSRVSARERREATERKNTELFEAVLKALKENYVFRKDGEPMLVIRTIAPQEIGMDTKRLFLIRFGIKETVKPGKIENFLDYLKNTSTGLREKRKRKIKERIRQDTAPFDKDDAVKNLR